MEEWIGEIWHKLISKKANTDHQMATIMLSELTDELALFYRANGGDLHKCIAPAPSYKLDFRRRLAQRIAGTHLKVDLCWQSDKSLFLPKQVAIFSDAKDNEFCFFWQTALAAKLPILNHWFVDNQQATLAALNGKPGLKKQYHQFIEKYLATRPEPTVLPADEKAQELAIRQALTDPGSIVQLPKCKRAPFPVLPWLYPAPLLPVHINADEDLSAPAPTSEQVEQVNGVTKSAQRSNDQKETDGLLVFLLESLFSWTENIELDRPQEENVDQDLSTAAEDLDIISLAKQRRASSAKIKFDLDLPAPYNDELAIGDGIKLPEWNYQQQKLVADFCLLQPLLADQALPQRLPAKLQPTAKKLRRYFGCLQLQSQWQAQQPFGSEIDLNAWIERSSSPTNHKNENFYLNRITNHRDLSCLLLADLSMSTDAAINAEQRVVDVIRDSILLFGEALDSAGDPFAIYGFSSIKNKQVRFNLLKNFSEPYSDETRGRILSVKPGFYTRMGAGIRQACQVLSLQATEKKLLLLISDGKPNDIDHYEGRYGIEDTRHAIQAAKRQGIQPFCITIDKSANNYLPYLFGEQGYVVIDDILRLPDLLPKLYLNLVGLH